MKRSEQHIYEDLALLVVGIYSARSQQAVSEGYPPPVDIIGSFPQIRRLSGWEKITTARIRKLCVSLKPYGLYIGRGQGDQYHIRYVGLL